MTNTTSGPNISLTSYANVSNSEEIVPLQPVLRSLGFVVSAICVCVFGCVGNIVYIMCFLVKKKLQTVSNYFLCILCLADLLACLGFNIYYVVIISNTWMLFYCRLWLTFSPVFAILSMYVQFIISVDRTVLVTQSVAVYRKWFTRRLCLLYSIGGFFFHLICVPVLMNVYYAPSSLRGTYNCISFPSMRVMLFRYLSVYYTFCSTYFVAALISYGALLWHVRKTFEQSLIVSQSYLKVSRCLLILCVFSFITALLPTISVYLSQGITVGLSNIIQESAIIISFLGFSVNPIVYGYRIKTYRDILKEMLCKRCDKQRVGPSP